MPALTEALNIVLLAGHRAARQRLCIVSYPSKAMLEQRIARRGLRREFIKRGAVRAGAWDRLLKAVSAAYEREYVCPLSADHRFSCMAKWHVGRPEGDPTASGLYAAAQCARRLSCRASGRRCPFKRSRHSGPAIAAACDS